MNDVSVLVVDDEKSIRKTVKIALEKEGCVVDAAESVAEGLALARSGRHQVMILDMRLPDGDGMEILQWAAGEGRETVVIMATAFGSIDSAMEAVKSGAYHYVVKPIEMESLKNLIREGLEKKRLLEENRRLKHALKEETSFSGIAFASEKMRRVVDLVRIAARTDNNVLITGETGTGKERIADAIHYNSSRSGRNFIKINCAALTETLLEDELFGHERGAFTDAKGQKKGIFELAESGSIQFDEIGCVPVSTQARLLRVIEDKSIRRLGGTETFTVDVRVIASTNENLEEAMAAGRFRSDLYYRLNVVKIDVPPLRERKEDIPTLAAHFVEKHGRAMGREGVKVRPDAMEILLEHNWPGNARELENVIQRAFMYDIDSSIAPEHLPPDLLKPRSAGVRVEIPEEGTTLKDFTRELVVQALEKTGGNKTQAAKLLGVSRKFIREHLGEEGGEQ